MKRAVLLYLLLTSAALAVQATYTIQLTDGRVITADEKLFVKDDIAYFTRRGVYFYMPSSKVDTAATERLNAVVITEGFSESAPAAPVVVAPKAPGVKPVVIGDEQLEVIRNRSRLANEGELTAPAGGAGEPGTPSSGGQAPQRTGGDRNELQSRANDLLLRRAGLQQDQTNFQNQLSALQDSFDQNPQQDQREQIQRQIDAVSSQLQTVQSDLAAVQGDLQSTQQQLSSAPIVVDMGNQGTRPPPAEANPPEE